jgi:hypothetical protein
LQHTGLILQNREKDYKPNWFFQNHIFQAFSSVKAIRRGLDWFAWLKLHPKFFERMKRDRKEKDDLRWFDLNETQMMGKWSPSLAAMYIQAFTR